MKEGNFVSVCGGNTYVHGFRMDELAVVREVREVPGMDSVMLCESMSRNHQGILMSNEVDVLGG